MSCCCCFRRTSNQQKHHLPHYYSSHSLPASISFSSSSEKKKKKIKLFSYSELRSATNNFHRTNKIGQGGFGTVYKATLRSGQDVAVKVLSAYSRQGIKEFLTEIDVIANVKHPNLVELVGCCVQGDHRILVYEYLHNGSLDRALLLVSSSSTTSGSGGELIMSCWGTRRGVCVGVARGLAFLHEDQLVVHRDIKASNVLLAAGHAPKIGDFGLAKLFPDNVTHISTRVAGTTGYLAPEYAWHGQLTKKADVYSFGVLVLETVTGRSSSKRRRSLLLSSDSAEDNKVLLEKAWELYEAGKLTDVIDPALQLEGGGEGEEAVRYMKVALLCTQAAPQRRPSMPQVVEMLEREDIRVRESELTPPGYLLKVPSSQSSAADNNNTAYSMFAPHTVSEMPPR